MKAEEIKALIRNYLEEVFNKGNPAAMDEFFSPGCTFYDLTTGQIRDLEGFKQYGAQLLVGVSNLHIDLDDIIVEGDRAAFGWAITLTDPQGQPARYNGITMYTFSDGRVVADSSVNALVKPA